MGKVAIATIVLMFVSLIVGATPANAATGDYTKFSFYGSKYNLLDTYEAKGIVRGSGAAISIKSYYSWRAVGGFKKPKIVVQRKLGKKWITQKSVSVKFTSRYSVTAEIPGYTVSPTKAKQKVQYRFKSFTSAKKHIITADRSSAFKVTYENQAAYTGLAASIYGGMAAYCPTATVRIDGSLDDAGHAGEYSIFKGIFIDPTVASYTPEYQLSVALHECAHMKQFYNWGASYKGDAKMERAAKKIYVADPDPTGASAAYKEPFKAIEHSADCASIAINPAGYLGYGGYCNQAELDAGVRLMQGKRF
jgi:hypothetical protein